MRMWHVELLPYLPDMQFRGQLRELVAIMHDWRDKGKTNHLLINHVMLYDKSDLYEYFRCYEEEWNRRYNKPLKEKYDQEFLDFCCNSHNFKRFRCYQYWHDKTYLKICMMNLFEKYCGVGNNKLSEAEWLRLCVGYKKITGEVYNV